MARIALFALSLLLVAAHLTGQMGALASWFDVRPEQLLYVLAVPFAFVATVVLLRDQA